MVALVIELAVGAGLLGLGYVLGKGYTAAQVKSELASLEASAVADAKTVIAKIKALL